MTKELNITDWKIWEEFINDRMKIYHRYDGRMLLFRGQTDFSWNLRPSLTRIVDDSDESLSKIEGYEKQAEMNFRSQAHLLGDDIDFYPEYHQGQLWIEMQHYSCPTRLLDWTTSPYVALYFAVNSMFDIDGAVFVFGFDDYQKNLSAKGYDISNLKADELLNFNEIDAVNAIFPVKKNHRVVRQQGCFTVSKNPRKPHDEIIREAGTNPNSEAGLLKLIISKDLKIEILARLKSMNIRNESLFPGLDGLGRSINEDLIIRKWDYK